MEPTVAPLTILLGRGTTAAAVRQALEDFAALGIVRNLIFIDADSFTHADSGVRLVRTMPDGSTRIEHASLTKALVDIDSHHREQPGVASLVLVNNIDEADGRLGPDNIAPVTLALDSVGYSSRLHRSNLMLTRANAVVETPLPTLRGYVNLMLAPEDAGGPDQPAATLDAGCRTHRLALHYAAGIASIYGAWTGSKSVPAHHMDLGQGDTFRLVRTYYRRIDGQQVQTRIKLAIFDTDTNPQAKLNRPGQAVYAHYPVDTAAFAGGCAEELIQEYEHTLTGARYQAITQALVHTTAGHALADFARAYGTNLVTAPSRFARRLRYDVATARDYAVQKHLYGVTGSRVQVGRAALATAPGGEDEHETDSEVATQAIATREEIASELEPLWRSYSNMALTMMDASPRAFGTSSAEARYPAACLEAGTSNVYVAGSADHVIPGPHTRFGRKLPPQLKNLMGEPIAGYDVVGAKAYERQLAQLTGSQHRAIGRTIGDFRQWRQKHAQSFAARTGAQLDAMRQEIMVERDGYLADIDRLSREQQPETTTDDSTTSALRFFGWVSLGSLVLFSGLYGIGHLVHNAAGSPDWFWVRALDATTAGTKATFFGVWFLLWLILWLCQVALETRDDIKDANRRRTVRSDMHTARDNALACEVAIKRIDVAYNQFLSVSHMLGAILEKPFGQVEKNEQRAVTPTNEMPRHVVLAEATPPHQAVRATIDRHRMSLYEEGWMGPLAGEALTQAATRLHNTGGITVDVEHLLGLPGDRTGSALDKISTIVSSPEFLNTDRTQRQWMQIIAQLADSNAHEDITAAAVSSHDGTLNPLSELGAVGSFNGQFLTEQGQTINRVGAVDQHYYFKGSSTIDAIGGGEVLVQLSRPAHISDVRLRSSGGAEPRPTPAENQLANPFASPDFFDQGDL
ncbi:hypothetical protein [Corynebacterium aquilae]|uniref:Uncharacterized protein n=1 Tax=Corynebacterium aquilae DSM 44791 TaxID=1431546 RepID=A0A1L7CI38_9CORY|nr:hypothetical protein [Corynebacterium aquilae]APT85514.1 hypothetical protein CAQU_11170 [Corynebacterium aquilae DSM 44791]